MVLDVIIYSAGISACGKGGQWPEALPPLRDATREKSRQRPQALVAVHGEKGGRGAVRAGGARGNGRQRLEALSLLGEIVDSARGQRQKALSCSRTRAMLSSFRS